MLLKEDKNYANVNGYVQYVGIYWYTLSTSKLEQMDWDEGEEEEGGWSKLVGDSGRWEAMVSTCPVNDHNCYLSMIQNYPDCGWEEEEEE